jgi:uncharacterized membrane protein
MVCACCNYNPSNLQAAVTGGVVAVQKKNRRAHLEASGSASSLNNPAVSSLQLSFFCSRGEEGVRTILDELRALASHADASTPAGLRAIVRESAVAALRAEDDWLGVSGGVQQFAGNGGGKAASTFVSCSHCSVVVLFTADSFRVLYL